MHVTKDALRSNEQARPAVAIKVIGTSSLKKIIRKIIGYC